MNIEAVLLNTPGIGFELYCRRPGCKNAPYFVHEGLACCAECHPVVNDFHRRVLRERKRVRDSSTEPAVAPSDQGATASMSSPTIADMFHEIQRLCATDQPFDFKAHLGRLAKFGGLIARSTVLPVGAGETLAQWMSRPEALAILKRMAGFGGSATPTDGPPDRQRGL